MKKVLNVGGNSKAISLPNHFEGYEHLLLDIDPKGKPDILCDARELVTFESQSFDAVYCSHNLEHYFRHDVVKVLAGFMHVLRDGGFAQIRVPDLQALMRIVVEKNMDVDDVLYHSPAGPIMVVDVLYGCSSQIERSGADFFAHKTGFTQKSLFKALEKAGFSRVYSVLGNLEINAIAFKGQPSAEVRALFKLPEDPA